MNKLMGIVIVSSFFSVSYGVTIEDRTGIRPAYVSLKEVRQSDGSWQLPMAGNLANGFITVSDGDIKKSGGFYINFGPEYYWFDASRQSLQPLSNVSKIIVIQKDTVRFYPNGDSQLTNNYVDVKGDVKKNPLARID